MRPKMNLFIATQCPSRALNLLDVSLLRASGTVTSVLGDSLLTYGNRTHINKTGGSGEIRTHGPFNGSTVFKTVAINRTLPHFHKLVEITGIEPVVPKAADLQSTASPLMLHLRIWWARRDSNSQSFRRWLLRPECIPFHHLPKFFPLLSTICKF